MPALQGDPGSPARPAYIREGLDPAEAPGFTAEEMEAMHLLVVDDELPIRELLKILLSAEGHRVTLCSDGQQGWEQFSQNPGDYHLVIADMHMPVLDGIGLLKRLREGGHRVPCILVTGSADLEDEELPLLDSAHLLQKPFDLKEMVGLVARLTAPA